ncbi:M56 family metallopeptidase [Hymenobacter convexus]|uniref:M56 family metallopeptidase n=1 Tax=Hymenobacter sp. CA1UV-4 TaxID=3063782 RepID=UPI002712ACCA|nr:M56 family metallopeptidase [Hymenobacter sp. CA1UV-4]MDO7851206.1 M56 family metallopeptidase [Hymenobacter sp. CA1UV-4]
MLSPTLLYLLKANGALLLFAAAYFGLLRRLTFFELNRAYLVFALLFSAVYPALPVPALLPPEAAAPVAVVLMDFATTAAVPAADAPAPIDWNAVALAVYGAGVAVGLGRLLMQLLSLARLRRRSRPAVVLGVAVRALPGDVSPFSFGSTIYLNPGRHPAAELAAVLRHEQVHVRQGHTLDVLLAHVAQAAAWCNPAAWLLRRALLDNLEYLADHAALQTGLDRQAYQYSLLRLSQVLPGPALVSHFTFPTLKNRVVMMNKPLSSTGQLARYFVAGPLVLAAALGFSGARAQGAGPAVPVAAQAASAQRDQGQEGATNYHATHYLDGKVSSIADELKLGAENVASMVALKGDAARKISGNPQDEYVMVMTSKQNQNRADVIAFNQKVAVAEARDKHIETGPAVNPADHQLPDGIKSYIAKTYPGSTVNGWFISDKASEKVPHVQYYASITASNGEKHKLYFNAAEQPVTALATARAAQPAGAATETGTSGPAPTPDKKTPPIVYVDGQRYTGSMKDLGPSNISNISVFKGDKARQLFGPDAGDGVLVVTTKANENSAEVRAFNDKLGSPTYGAAPAAAAAPAPATASVPYLAAPALAYLTQHYPAARLLGVTELKDANGGPSRYQAEIVIGRRPGYVTFDGTGKFISESYTR